jgi:phosphatidylglycerophosphate synthase
MGGKAFLTLGVIFFWLYLIFDFVDGNIARVTDQVNFFGKFLDGVVDMFVEISIPLSLAIGYFLATGSEVILYSGIAVSFLRLYSAYIYTRLSFINRWAEKEVQARGDTFSKESLNPLKAGIFPIEQIVNITTDIKIIAITLLLSDKLFSAAVVILLAVIALQGVILTLSPLVDASRTLRIPYTSVRDPRAQNPNTLDHKKEDND